MYPEFRSFAQPALKSVHHYMNGHYHSLYYTGIFTFLSILKPYQVPLSNMAFLLASANVGLIGSDIMYITFNMTLYDNVKYHCNITPWYGTHSRKYEHLSEGYHTVTN